MEASATAVIICFVVCFQTSYWRRQCGDGSNFFLRIYFQNFLFSHMIQIIIIFTLAWKGGERSDYLFPSLFSDYIFLLGQEHGDGSLGAGAWGLEQFLGMIYFQKNIFHRRIQNAFFHIGMEAWARGVIISFAVCFWTTYFCRTGSWGWERVNGSVRIGFFSLKIV